MALALPSPTSEEAADAAPTASPPREPVAAPVAPGEPPSQPVAALISSDGWVAPTAQTREVAGRFFQDLALEALALVLLSSNDEETLRSAALRLGAAGWACKGDLPGLLRTLKRVLGPTAQRGADLPRVP